MRGWSHEAGVTIATGRLVVDTCTLLLLLLDDVSVATSVAIEHCCYQETANYNLLALVCNNGEKREWLVGVVYHSLLSGYIIFRLQPFLCQPVIKQLKWFEVIKSV